MRSIIMELTKQEKYFLNIIENTCKKVGTLNRILPSMIGALAIYESSWGTRYGASKNLFCLAVNIGNQSDKIYSINTGKIYHAKDDSKKPDEYYPIYIKAYADYRESIDDFVSYLVNERRSPDGPFKFENLKNCIDYKEAVERLYRDGYYTYVDTKNTAYFTSNIISIIEKYELYKWDEKLIKIVKEEEEEMSKRKRSVIVQQEKPVVASATEEVVEESTPVVQEEEVVTEEVMYRVRLDWEKVDTQIFASPVLEDAIEEASAHEGYKVYNGNTGELVNDPWIVVEEEVVEKLPYKEITSPSHGRPVILDHTAVYRTTKDKKPFKYFSGQFYYYDNTVTNGRAKICKDLKTIKRKDVNKILGYIEVKV